MTRLSKRMLWLLAAVLAVAIAASVLLNARLVEPAYIALQKRQLEAVCGQLALDSVSLEGFIAHAEAQQNVVIARVADDGDVDAINQRLYTAFVGKGLGLERFWLWEEDYRATVQNGSQQRIYSQGKLNYSLLVQYQAREGELLAVAMVIPNISGTVTLVNWLTVALFGAVALVLLGLVWLSTRQTATAQLALEQKNQQMERLLQAVSHDLKTPISLIKAYAAGMQDGLDDGSFLETIAAQSRTMEQMVEQLLTLSRSGRGTASIERQRVDLGLLMEETLAAQSIAIQQKGIALCLDIAHPLSIDTDPAAMASVFENLLGNAVKYTADGMVSVTLQQGDNSWRLEVSNGLAPKTTLDIARLWEPYYVGESSRNRALSGSGLGLAIVRAACDSLGLRHGCTVEESQFRAWVEGDRNNAAPKGRELR